MYFVAKKRTISAYNPTEFLQRNFFLLNLFKIFWGKKWCSRHHTFNSYL